MSEIRTPDPATAVLYQAVLHPHRSMTLRGARLVVVLVACASIVASIPFLIMGFWPVAGFYGLDVALLWFALRTNVTEAQGYEEVQVSPLELLLRKVPVRGLPAEFRFNPVWTKLQRFEHHEFGVQHLSLVSRGQSVSVGHFLSPDEKAILHEGLSAALATARRGPVFGD